MLEENQFPAYRHEELWWSEMRESYTARLIVLNKEGRILLMNVRIGPDASSGERASTIWVTLGGRLEKDEDVLTAARRELREETGIVDAEVGPPIWYGEQILDIDGEPTLLKETFVLVQCERDEMSNSGWTPEERSAIIDMRWWSREELHATSEIVKPPNLAALLESTLSAGKSGSIPRIDLNAGAQGTARDETPTRA